MRRHAVTLVLTATLLSPSAVLAAKPAPASLTVATTPATVTFGKATTLSGKLTGGKSVGGQTVDVEADTAPFEGTYAQVATAVTDAAGAWTATTTPTALTRYRARAHTSPPTTSSTVDVAVRLRVGVGVSDRTPQRGQRVRFSGRVAPAHDGAPALIQRRTASGAWVTVARTTLVTAGTDVSRYSKRVRVRRTGTYRVRVRSGDTDHLNGTSGTRKLTVAG
jgi:hypothetical protein